MILRTNFDTSKMTIAAIKSDLPNMPDDVIDMWLSTFYNRYGWPPLVDNGWRFVLRPPSDLSSLQKLRWQKEVISIYPEMLMPDDKQRVVDLYLTHVVGINTIYSGMSDGLSRFKSCFDYIKANGVFPRPVVLQRRKDGFWILDGNHRLTAFFYLSGYFRTNDPDIPDLNVSEHQEIWVAT